MDTNGRCFRNIALHAFLALFFLAFSAQAQKIDPALQEALKTNPEKPLTVIIAVENQEKNIDATPDFQAGLPLYREKVQNELMRQAVGSQARLLKSLAAKKSTNQPLMPTTEVISLWINNSLITHLTGKEIAAIAKHPQVKAVYADREYALPAQGTRQTQLPEIQANNRLFVRGEDGLLYTYGLKMIGVPTLRLQEQLDGRGVLIGHMDSGVDGKHGALAGKIAAFKDFIGEAQGAGQAYDDHGHGTHTAGTMVGEDPTGKIHFGVAPKAKLISAKVFSGDGFTRTSILLQAMQWLADPDGDPKTDDAPQVINNSWGGPAKSRQEETPFWDAVNNWVRLGIFPVFSAGNEGDDRKGKEIFNSIGTPAAFPQSFAVAATDVEDKIASYSSRGEARSDYCANPTCRENPKPDLAAPGSDVYSARPDGQYGLDSGTSMAAPHVTGLIALLLQKKKLVTVPEMRALLINSAVYKEEPSQVTRQDLRKRDYNLRYGYGRLDGIGAANLSDGLHTLFSF